MFLSPKKFTFPSPTLQLQQRLRFSLLNTIQRIGTPKIKYWSEMSRQESSKGAEGLGPINDPSAAGVKVKDEDLRDHLKVTAAQQRDRGIHDMKVTTICDISPTVKKLVLHTEVRPVPFSFKPGQWVDVFIPGVDKVGGFSMTSSPMHLLETGNLNLAVKCSDNPPARWVHTDCKVGSPLSIRVGGDFFLDVKSLNKEPRKILLIAGGVGINPLASMVAEIRDVNLQNNLKTVLLFSAKTFDELLFRDVFDEAEKQHRGFKPYYFLTAAKPVSTSEGKSIQRTSMTLIDRRINSNDVEMILRNHFNLQPHSEDLKKTLLAYVCGPPTMITSMQTLLISFGARASNIYFENWWQEE